MKGAGTAGALVYHMGFLTGVVAAGREFGRHLAAPVSAAMLCELADCQWLCNCTSALLPGFAEGRPSPVACNDFALRLEELTGSRKGPCRTRPAVLDSRNEVLAHTSMQPRRKMVDEGFGHMRARHRMDAGQRRHRLRGFDNLETDSEV